MSAHEFIIRTLNQWHPPEPGASPPAFTLDVRLINPESAAGTRLIRMTPLPPATASKSRGECSVSLERRPSGWSKALLSRLNVGDEILVELVPGADATTIYWELAVPSPNREFQWITRGSFDICVGNGRKKEIAFSLDDGENGKSTSSIKTEHSGSATLRKSHESPQLGYGPAPKMEGDFVPKDYIWVDDAQCFFASTAVSQEDWEEVMSTTLHQWVANRPARQRDSVLKWKQHSCMPMIGVRLADAMEFCHRLTRSEHKSGRLPQGWVYRLPTPAEWLCAFQCPQSSQVWSARTLAEAGKRGPQPVRGHESSQDLFHHMCGNVWEWTPDLRFNPSFTSRAPAIGGSWYREDERHCREVQPCDHVWDYSSSRMGFRPVLAPLFKRHFPTV